MCIIVRIDCSFGGAYQRGVPRTSRYKTAGCKVQVQGTRQKEILRCRCNAMQKDDGLQRERRECTAARPTQARQGNSTGEIGIVGRSSSLYYTCNVVLMNRVCADQVWGPRLVGALGLTPYKCPSWEVVELRGRAACEGWWLDEEQVTPHELWEELLHLVT